jgi:hypothetical protein
LRTIVEDVYARILAFGPARFSFDLNLPDQQLWNGKGQTERHLYSSFSGPALRSFARYSHI